MDFLVVIIENDYHFSYLLKRYAENYGCQVYCSDKVEGIFSYMRDNMPVTLFMDIDLPEKQFQHALEKLEQDDVLSKIPVIACTWNDESVFSKIEGVAASVNKSLLYEDFVKILERVSVNLKDDLSGGEIYVNE